MEDDPLKLWLPRTSLSVANAARAAAVTGKVALRPMILLLQAPPGGIPLRDALRDALSWHAALAVVQVPLHDGRASLSPNLNPNPNPNPNPNQVPLGDGRASLSASCTGKGCVLPPATATATTNDTAAVVALSGGGGLATAGLAAEMRSVLMLWNYEVARLEADPDPLATIEAALRLPTVGPLLAGTVRFEDDPVGDPLGGDAAVAATAEGSGASAGGGGGGGGGEGGEGGKVRVRALLLVYELSREGAEGAAAEELERKLAALLYGGEGDAFGAGAGAGAKGEAIGVDGGAGDGGGGDGGGGGGGGGDGGGGGGGGGRVLEPLLFGEAALGDELNRAIGTDVRLIMLDLQPYVIEAATLRRGGAVDPGAPTTCTCTCTCASQVRLIMLGFMVMSVYVCLTI